MGSSTLRPRSNGKTGEAPANGTGHRARVAWYSGNGEDTGTLERLDASTPRCGTE